MITLKVMDSLKTLRSTHFLKLNKSQVSRVFATMHCWQEWPDVGRLIAVRNVQATI